MESEHWENKVVAQDKYGICTEPILFSTEGLGPCIGVCIAWKCWAAILHSSDINLDEDDLVRPMLEEAKKAIPAETRARIRPVVCGGDTSDFEELSDDPKDFERTMLESRERIQEILKEAGFGKPNLCWNTPGGRMSLVADLKAHVIVAEIDGEEVGRWAIDTKNAIDSTKRAPRRRTK